MKLDLFIYLITVIILIIVGYIDYKKRIISNKINIILASIGVINIILDFNNVKMYLVSTAIVFTFFLLLSLFSNGGIGGGDIKLFTSLALIFGKGILQVLQFTYAAAAITLIPGIFTKKVSWMSTTAMGPFVAIGTLIHVINLI